MTDPIVRTSAGAVRGRDADGVAVFRGIPYAASTEGAGRWAAPSARPPWAGELDATHAGPVAPQNPSMLERMLGGGGPPASEDCLHLNVWTPGCDDGARPVMVWVHGGAFETGSGSVPWYDGRALARRGVVVVSLNYRLGCLGFLHLSGISGDESVAGSGVLGLLDQVQALRWVQHEIARFGGDPANVTVFGESAGAMSIGALLGLPAARGLFRRAVLQSGAATHVRAEQDATEVAERFVGHLGEDPAATDLAERLRARSVEELLQAQAAVGVRRSGALAWMPVVDGVALPEPPLVAVGRGAAAGVDLLLGTTLEEMALFLLAEPGLADLDEDGLAARVTRVAVRASLDPARMLEAYGHRLRDGGTPRDALVAVLTDQTFRVPAIRLAEAQAAHATVRSYLFAYRTEAFGGLLGSCHALEIPFVWDALDASGVDAFAGPPTDATRTLARRMADCWAAFARDGEPCAEGVPPWPPYDADRRATLWLDTDRVEVVDDPFGAERAVWDDADLTRARA